MEQTLTRSCQGWATRVVSRGSTLLVGRDDLQAGRHRLAPAEPVLHVHGVVLAVVAPEAEEDRRPAPLAEPLLLERPVEVQLAADQLVVARPPPAARRSRTPGSAARRPRGSGTRQRAHAAAPAAARRRALSPSRCSTTSPPHPAGERLARPVAAHVHAGAQPPRPGQLEPRRPRLHRLEPPDERAALGRARAASARAPGPAARASSSASSSSAWRCLRPPTPRADRDACSGSAADGRHRARRLAEARLAHVVLQLLAPDGVAHDPSRARRRSRRRAAARAGRSRGSRTGTCAACRRRSGGCGCSPRRTARRPG